MGETVRRMTREPKDVGTDVAVRVGDAEAAKKRQRQLIEGTRLQETVIKGGGGDVVPALFSGGAVRPGEVATGGEFRAETRDIDTKRTKELRTQAEDAEMSRLQREIDLARGRERGEMDFYEGALGRVGEGVSPEIQALQDARMGIAQQGYGAEAFQAAREQRLDALGRGELAQQRQLRGLQGATGVQGGIAGLQQVELMRGQQRERQAAERQLFLDEVAQKQQALGAAEQTVRGTEADTLSRQQYNIAQRKAELMGRLTAQYGEAALGVAERTSARSAQAAKDYAQAVRNQGGGGKK